MRVWRQDGDGAGDVTMLVKNVKMSDKRCWGVYWLVETQNMMLLETLVKVLVKKVEKVVVKMEEEKVVVKMLQRWW